MSEHLPDEILGGRTPMPAAENDSTSKTPDVRGVIGYVLAAVFFLTCVCFAIWGIPDSPVLNVLLVMFGAAAGWLIGILASPDDTIQEKRFRGYGSIIASLLTGFVAGKLDHIWDTMAPAIVFGPLFFERLLLVIIAGLTATLVTFIGRTYSGRWG
jgi:hypothetical protein